MGTAVGIWQMMEQKDIAEEQMNLQMANLRTQAEEQAKAEAQMEAEKKNAAASTAATGKTPEIEDVGASLKKKKGVQSTFTATGAGAGNMKGTTLSPLGGDNEE